MTLLFTQPTRPIRWKRCPPDHTISIDVNLTNPVKKMTRISTWTNQITQDNQMKLVFTWPSRWNRCSPDHIMNNEVHLTIQANPVNLLFTRLYYHWCSPDLLINQFTLPEIHQTYQSNQVKLLYIWPYHQLWCSPDQPGPPGKADVHLTIPWIADNQQYTAVIILSAICHLYTTCIMISNNVCWNSVLNWLKYVI